MDFVDFVSRCKMDRERLAEQMYRRSRRAVAQVFAEHEGESDTALDLARNRVP